MRLRNLLIAGCLFASTSARANTATTFPSGSLIIPVTASFQDDCGAVSSYGLIYDVLRANPWLATNGYSQITIYYAYLDTKLSPNRCVPTSLDPNPSGTGTTAQWNDGCDITNVQARLITNSDHTIADANIITYTTTGKTGVYPTFTTRTLSTITNTTNYGGGPFIILAQDATTFRQLLDGTLVSTIDGSHPKDVNGNLIDFSPFRTRNTTEIAAPASSNVNSQCTLGTDHYVNIHKAANSFTANIGKAFQNTPPRLALLATDKTDGSPSSSGCGVGTGKEYDGSSTTGSKKICDGILENYLQNAGLTYTGANGCQPGAVTANKSGCPGGTTSTGQIYDALDFSDLATHLSDTTGTAKTPLYAMLWTPHWETTSACSTLHNCTAGSKSTCSCTSNCTSSCKATKGTCTDSAGSPFTSCASPNTPETAALNAISTFLDGQSGLAAECASIESYEGSISSSGTNTKIAGLQLQTAGTTYGVVVNPSGAPVTRLQNCSDPTVTASSQCMYFSYPGDSFAQTGDYEWDAVSGAVTGYDPNTSESSSYKAGVVPLISVVSSLVSADLASPTPYNGSTWSASVNTSRPMISADLITRNIKDNTAGKANIMYLAGHDESVGVAGTKVMLQTLLQLGLSTLPPIYSTTEVSRNSPIVATINGTAAVVQGTYLLQVPASAPTTYSVNGDSSTFKFPAIKGHMRARTASTISTTATLFGSTGTIFDAATAIPTPTPAGCSTWFTSACRTVFTTLQTGVAPPIHYVTTAEVGTGTVGAALATNTTGVVDLDTPNQTQLLQRILAGDDSAALGFFLPALGGVDRSTVAIIGPSSLVTGGSTRPTMAYFGADDGMMHAVCASTGGACDVLGRELWAYIPRTELGLERYNTGRVDGSPRVFDAFVSNGLGERSWRTVLVFQTGTGDTTLQSRTPAVYAMDVSNPTAPTVLWEYSMANVGARGQFELGQGLTVAGGQVQTGTTPKFMVYAQTNNAGTLGDSGGSGNVVTAINVDTGLKEWQNGYQFLTTLRSGGTSIPSGTGMPGGAVGIDKTQQGYITDLVYGTLYGDLWEVDPTSGLSRYAPGTLPAAGNPLLRFSTDKHAIGATPAIYSLTAGGPMYAAFATGGYTDSYPNDTTWTTPTTTQYAMSVNLNTPTTDATINENKGTPDIPIKFALGTGEAGYAEITVIDGQLYITSDTADVNNNSSTGGYGTGAASGHVYAYTISSGVTTTTIIQGGANSVVASGTTVYNGAGADQQQIPAAAGGTGTPVETTLASKMTRRLWLRTQ